MGSRRPLNGCSFFDGEATFRFCDTEERSDAKGGSGRVRVCQDSFFRVGLPAFAN
jgi:hypothetical protein